MGVDFAGPLYVRASTSSENVDEKCYVCLFTCATTRAVHLELTRNLTVDSFLLAFRPTHNLGYRQCEDIQRCLQREGENFEVKGSTGMRYVTSKRIQWNSWWGGFRERMIQSVKQCLRKAIGRTTVTYDEVNMPYVEDSQHGISYSCHLPTWLTGAESSIRRMEVTLKLWAVTCRCQRESSTPSSLAVVHQQMEERLFTESAREAHTRFNPSKGIGDYCGRCSHHEERLPCRECFGN